MLRKNLSHLYFNRKETFQSKWMRRSNMFYFFIAWNALALCAYNWYKYRQENNSDWQNLSGTQKYLYFMNRPNEKIKVVKYQGLTKVHETESTYGGYMQPAEDTKKES